MRSYLLVLLVLLMACTTREQARPPVIPYWALQPGIWEDDHNTEAYLRDSLVPGYLSRDIPVGFIVVDSPWSETYNDFIVDRTRYPTFEKMVADFRRNGISTVVWLTGAVNRNGHDSLKNRHPDFDLVLKKGWYVTLPGRKDPAIPWWKGRGLYVDFTNPQATEFFYKMMDRVVAAGIRGFKVDQIDVSTNGAKFLITGDGRRIFPERYRKAYYRAMFRYLRDRGLDDFMIMARPYTHQFDRQGHEGAVAPKDAVHLGWAGDFSGAFDRRAQGLQLQQEMLYESARLGYAGLLVEIGGFYKQPPSKQSLLRGAQFAAFMPGWLNGGGNGGDAEHLPWFHDPETVDIYRTFSRLKSELSPYVFSLGVEAALTGKPIIRAPDTENGSHLLGPNVFVQTVTQPLKAVEGGIRISLPKKDAWVDLWGPNGSLVEGGAVIDAEPRLDRVPAYVRVGSILPLNVPERDSVLGAPSCGGKDAFLIVPGKKALATVHLPAGEGTDYYDVKIGYRRGPKSLDFSVRSQEVLRSCFMIVTADSPLFVSGADRWDFNAKRSYTILEKTGTEFKIHLQFDDNVGAREPIAKDSS